MRIHSSLMTLVAVFGLWSGAFPVGAQNAPPPQPAPASPTAPAAPAPPQAAPASTAAAAAAPSADKPPFKQEELDQMLAPLALYPDPLLSQVLMACTYPIEVVESARWIKANAALKGDALTTELEKKSWDPSVKSLVNFPEVLESLSEKLEWTVKIGDAFIADQKLVMDTVQKLRAKAQEAGNLKSSKEQTVTVQPASGTNTQVIVIEPTDPEVIYVPAYNPTVVYGSWWYPSYPPPPPYYYPPGYGAHVAFSFAAGVAVGAAWGYAWGHCNWGGSDVDIDINRNTNINNKIDRSKHQNNIGGGKGKGNFQHDPSHRKGASYRDSATSNRYGGAANKQASQSREAFRGRAESGRQELSRSGAGGPTATNRAAGTGASRPASGAATRPSQGATSRPSTTSGSKASSGSRSSAFQGSGSSGSSTRAASSRGSSSRGGGGASRGGGGGRGGGGRR